jgi:hypothetical protein
MGFGVELKHPIEPEEAIPVLLQYVYTEPVQNGSESAQVLLLPLPKQGDSSTAKQNSMKAAHEPPAGKET